MDVHVISVTEYYVDIRLINIPQTAGSRPPFAHYISPWFISVYRFLTRACYKEEEVGDGSLTL